MNSENVEPKTPKAKSVDKASIAETAKSNIFDFRIWDALAYLFLYIIIPVSVAAINLNSLFDAAATCAYSYLSVLISLMGGIYDAASRMTKLNSRKKDKLIFVMTADFICSVYCFFELLFILLTSNIHCRLDGVLLFYGVTVVIAGWDLAACLAKNSTIPELLQNAKGKETK